MQHKTLETLRKERLRELPAKLPDGPVSSPDELGYLRNSGFFDLKPDDLNHAVLDRAAALCVVAASIETIPQQYPKAYVPEQRFLFQSTEVAHQKVLPGELMLLLKDRTLLKLSPRINQWSCTLEGWVPDDCPLVTNGMHKKNTESNPATTGRKMCCAFEQGKCSDAACLHAHVVDGRPCEDPACGAHTIVRLLFPVRPAEWFCWLRTDDQLPVIGIETADGAKMCRLPSVLLEADEESFHQQLPSFFGSIRPKPKKAAKEPEVNRQKYFETLAASVYRKWLTAQKLSRSPEDIRKLVPQFYPASWVKMIETDFYEMEEPEQDSKEIVATNEQKALGGGKQVKYQTAPELSRGENDPKVIQEREDWKLRFMYRESRE